MENDESRTKFTYVYSREARVANSHILSWAQRFANDSMHLFGARTALCNTR